MKKQLIIAGISALMLSTTMTYANPASDNAQSPQKPACKCKCNKQLPPKMQKQKRIPLDEQLNLSEEQKAKAHEIRMEGREKMKPVFEKIKAKHQEIKEVQQSNLSQEEKTKKLTTLKKDMKQLKREIRKISNENTQEFEAILTPEQKAKFEKIKQDARARHQQMKKNRANRPAPDKK